MTVHSCREAYNPIANMDAYTAVTDSPVKIEKIWHNIILIATIQLSKTDLYSLLSWGIFRNSLIRNHLTFLQKNHTEISKNSLNKSPVKVDN